METGSFTKAGEKNFISQSAVSQRLRVIERKYGQKFLERSKGKTKVVPTAAGRVLYDSSKELLLQMDLLDAKMKSLSDEIIGTVRVSTVYSLGMHTLPDKLKPFLAQYPNVKVHLEYSHTSRVYRDVLSGVVDVGVVAVPAEKPGVEILPFSSERMVLICSPNHKLASLSHAELCDLEGENFIAFDNEIPTRMLIDEHLNQTGVHVNISMAYDNIETLKNLVEIGRGVSLVPEGTVSDEVSRGSLVSVPLGESSFHRISGIILKKAQSRPAAVRAFVEAISPG